MGGVYVDGDNKEWATPAHCGNADSFETIPLGISAERCYWKGPAFNTSNGLFENSELAQMVNQRLSSNNTVNRTEVVLDERGMQSILLEDPGSLITAFLYAKNSNPIDTGIARDQAKQMQIDFQKEWGLKVPIVAVDVEV